MSVTIILSRPASRLPDTGCDDLRSRRPLFSHADQYSHSGRRQRYQIELARSREFLFESRDPLFLFGFNIQQFRFHLALGRDHGLKLPGTLGLKFAQLFERFDFLLGEVEPTIRGGDLDLVALDQIAGGDQFPDRSGAGPGQAGAFTCRRILLLKVPGKRLRR